MAHKSALIASDIDAYLLAHQHKTLLRFITCGSVDDGKSTLIGRLLYESKMIFDDQLAALDVDSKKIGTRGKELDFALLVDGLAAEREQGITIDVAYRFFSTERRKFIVADTPGHEQYTRNMVTGASTADVAVILIDARKGILTQTRRHSFLVSLLGIRHIVLAINKMDLIGYEEQRFEGIAREYREFAKRIELIDITAIPISAVYGDNVIERGANMPWYRGLTLMEHLETVEIEDASATLPFRMPIQWVNRPNSDFRGFAGRIEGGTIRPGDPLRILPSGRVSRVARIVTSSGELSEAVAGQSVTLTLADEVDASRGDVFAGMSSPPEVADQFDAMLVGLDGAILPGRSYSMKIGAKIVKATVNPLKYKLNINTLEQLAAERLELNDIGACELELDRAIVFEPYRKSRELGGFILIDPISNATVAAGTLNFALRRSQNVHWQALDVNKAARAAQNGQRPCTLWLTGYSGAGKSTIANLVEKKLFAMGKRTYLLDGDNVRHGINKDLGFTDQDRVENIRRVAEVARLMVDAGLIVMVSFISPFRAERNAARALFGAGEFFEIFVDTPFAEAERRDVKGLYKKARSGELKNFTGIDSPYEPPESPEIRIDTTALNPAQAADEIIERLTAQRVLKA
ncbi:MAG TPA: sulfate adenylyltransferase subunit CysN [Steroidobacteraceae bacterium]|jgi:bifunctional enzyme CysN/CysC|nr:sulfate adenylyltransferase subunit CysN [Steroidobacteraceae bacterium]